jgi:hypothetical protein
MRFKHYAKFLLPLAAAAGLLASEHRGLVKFSGLPLPGATITASQGDKKFSAVTDADGAYVFPNLADGVWTLDIEMLCFAPLHQEVAVAPNAPSPVWDLKLLSLDEIKTTAAPKAAPAAETVTAGAPSVAAPAPASKPAKGGKGVPPPPVSNPAGGFQRASLNASDNGAKPASETQTPANEDTNGSVPSDGLLINGSVNNGAASPFAQSAAFGNARRNGRSLYNGNLGFILDNSNLDARSYSLNGANTVKPDTNHFQGVFAFGGPLPVPGMQRLRRPNFVVNYQWTRNRTATTTPATMPTEALRSGDLSSLAVPIYDPASSTDPTKRQPFPGNVIPQNRISPQATSLLSLYPDPNFSGGTFNYQVPLISTLHQDDLQARMNKTIGRSNQVNGTFGLSAVRSANPNIFNFQDANRRLGFNTTVNWMHRFSQRMFLTLGTQYSRLSIRNTPYFAFQDNVAAIAGITGNNQDPANWGPSNLNFASGIASLGDGGQSFTRTQTSGYTVDLFWNHAPHNFRFGLDVKRQQVNLLSQQDPRGTFTFNGAATQAVDANGVSVPRTGSDFAGFLLGIPDAVSLATGNADKYLRFDMWDAYFNDDWRVGPGFTLNAGARWEYGSPASEKYGRLVNLDIAPGWSAISPVVGLSPTGSLTGQQYPGSLIRPDRLGFEPRIGFAWHPILASSLVVRGGYGVYYDTSVFTGIAAMMAQQAPLSNSFSIQNNVTNPFTMAARLDKLAPPTPNTFAVDPNFQVGYSQNWQLSAQRDLPGSMVITATYLGTKGTRARQSFLPNTYPAGVTSPCPACPSGFVFLTSNGNSTREAGQVQLRRRLRAGITATLNYTYSKSIDDASLGGRNQQATVQTAALIAQNWLDLAGERALSNFDQRHLVSFNAQYTSGMGIGGGTLLSGWRGAMFKDWTVATQVNAGTGFPLSPVFPSTVKGTGLTGPLRPDYTGAPLYDPQQPGLFLNPAAFTAPVGHFGNAGRNSITGPSTFTMGASLARTFRIDERRNIDLRFDATNALNHVTYPSWVTTVGSSQFGLPTSANQMRVIQTTLRMRF